MNMPTWGIQVTEEMDAAMKRVLEKNGATISSVMRRLAEDYLKENGEPVETKIRWGGDRKGKKTQRGPKQS